jgi:hypothetical protein
MTMDNNNPLTTMDKIKYCLHVWVYNHERFLPCEIDYYQGLSNRQPHGLNNFYWQKAYKLYSAGIFSLGTNHFTWYQ